MDHVDIFRVTGHLQSRLKCLGRIVGKVERDKQPFFVVTISWDGSFEVAGEGKAMPYT